MDKEELKEMHKHYNKDSEVWKKAFKIYNEDPKNNKLSMFCKTCYRKVFMYHLDKDLSGS